MKTNITNIAKDIQYESIRQFPIFNDAYSLYQTNILKINDLEIYDIICMHSNYIFLFCGYLYAKNCVNTYDAEHKNTLHLLLYLISAENNNLFEDFCAISYNKALELIKNNKLIIEYGYYLSSTKILNNLNKTITLYNNNIEIYDMCV